MTYTYVSFSYFQYALGNTIYTYYIPTNIRHIIQLRSLPIFTGINSRRSRQFALSRMYSSFKCFVVIYVFLCAKRQAGMEEDFSECI